MTRADTAVEVTQRTLWFSFDVQGGDVVRILDTGENILVLRPHKRVKGWVVKRAMGTNKRTPFGASQAMKVTSGVIPPGKTMVTTMSCPTSVVGF